MTLFNSGEFIEINSLITREIKLQKIYFLTGA